MRKLTPVLILALFVAIVVQLAEFSQEAPRKQPQPKPQPKVEVKVLAFSSENCSACRRDKRNIEKLRQQGVNVCEVDINARPDLARQHNVRQVPTYIVLQDGVEVRRTGSIVVLLKILAVILKIAIPIIIG